MSDLATDLLTIASKYTIEATTRQSDDAMFTNILLTPKEKACPFSYPYITWYLTDGGTCCTSLFSGQWWTEDVEKVNRLFELSCKMMEELN